MTFRPAILLLALLLPACAAPPAPPLQRVRELHPDGTLSAPLADKDLSPFQTYLRTHTTLAATSVFALETDLPEGAGTEGNYLALVRTAAGTELQYIEQDDHRPRADRYYHRLLTADEVAQFDAFMQAHPLAQIAVFNPLALEEPTNQPATQPVVAPPTTEPDPTTEPTTEPAAATTEPTTQPATQPTEPMADTLPADTLVQFRFTDMQRGEGRTVVVPSPGRDDHPAVDLLRLLARFRDASPYECTYLRAIPLTARVMYAAPYRKVLFVWNGADDGALRIGVSGAVRPLEEVPESGDTHWLVYQGGTWQPCAEPGTEPQTQPATEPATEPATQPGAAATTAPTTMSREAARALALAAAAKGDPAATLPSAQEIVRQWRLNHSNMIPRDETWWTAPTNKGTMMYHYVPDSPTSGTTHGFQVPTLEFDDEHFAVDAAGGKLYLIHDGQLFALEIPQGARK